jgi:hypothetical protein
LIELGQFVGSLPNLQLLGQYRSQGRRWGRTDFVLNEVLLRTGFAQVMFLWLWSRQLGDVKRRRLFALLTLHNITICELRDF